MSESETITPELNPSESVITNALLEERPLDRQAELAQRIWRTVEQTWFLSAIGIALLLLLFCALLLPQMPGQFQNDPTGARRWILLMSENYGPVGNGLRALGLFNVLNSPLLQLLLIALALVILIRLGNQLALAWRLQRIDHWFLLPIGIVGTPIAIPAVQTLYRLRQLLMQEEAGEGSDGASDPTSDEEVYQKEIYTELYHRFEQVEEGTVTVTASATPSTETETAHVASDEQSASPTEDDQQITHGNKAEPEPGDVTETRYLATRHRVYSLLRPFTFLGLLLVLVTLWITILWGWEINPEPLAPGADYRSALQGLVLSYAVTDISAAPIDGADQTTTNTSGPTLASPIAGGADQEQSISDSLTPIAAEAATSNGTTYGPTLIAQVGEATYEAPINRAIRLDWGELVIGGTEGTPALYMRTLSNEPLLSRLGQSQMVPSMGLRFPSIGSEESIVVAQALGMRIIRQQNEREDGQSTQFLAELYDANNAMFEQLTITDTLTTDVTIDDQQIAVQFIILPEMIVTVASRPAIWLLWPALLLTIVGLAGYLRNPAFLLVQVAPWPVDRVVVVAQSDDRRELDWFAEWLEK